MQGGRSRSRKMHKAKPRRLSGGVYTGSCPGKLVKGETGCYDCSKRSWSAQLNPLNKFGSRKQENLDKECDKVAEKDLAKFKGGKLSKRRGHPSKRRSRPSKRRSHRSKRISRRH